mmetsp:Transcript_8649/g.24314  ORF Transcript_8649/g.24314 Transcript_8649/m.24314 type:complete len:202 (+) Transcript_8649:182-787(+)
MAPRAPHRRRSRRRRRRRGGPCRRRRSRWAAAPPRRGSRIPRLCRPASGPASAPSPAGSRPWRGAGAARARKGTETSRQAQLRRSASHVSEATRARLPATRPAASAAPAAVERRAGEAASETRRQLPHLQRHRPVLWQCSATAQTPPPRLLAALPHCLLPPPRRAPRRVKPRGCCSPSQRRGGPERPPLAVLVRPHILSGV